MESSKKQDRSNSFKGNNVAIDISARRHPRRLFVNAFTQQRTTVTLNMGSKAFLPNLHLDAHTEGFISTNKRVLYDPYQRVRMQGELNDLFQLYAPQGLETDALTLLDPPMLLKLRDYLKDFDLTTDDGVVTLDLHGKQDREGEDLGLDILCKQLDWYFRSPRKRSSKRLSRLPDTRPLKVGRYFISTKRVIFLAAIYCTPILLALFVGLVHVTNPLFVNASDLDFGRLWSVAAQLLLASFAVHMLLSIKSFTDLIGFSPPSTIRKPSHTPFNDQEAEAHKYTEQEIRDARNSRR